LQRYGIVLIFFVFLVFNKEAAGKDGILVSVLPQKFFVEKIVKKSFRVTALVPKGSSPASYSLKPYQIKAIKNAKLYFTTGVPFEKNWIPKIKSYNPHIKIVSLSKGMELTNKDPHIWLSPPLVILQARNILQEILKINPEKSKEYFENYLAFLKELNDIDLKIMKMLSKTHKKSFMVYHPSFGYFAKAYGLHQISIEKGGKKPKATEIEKALNTAKELGINTIFVFPQFPKKSAVFLARKIGAKVEIIDPLEYKWSKNILKVAEKIAKACSN
jgi:zinc transport system substrate-binding protein